MNSMMRNFFLPFCTVSILSLAVSSAHASLVLVIGSPGGGGLIGEVIIDNATAGTTIGSWTSTTDDSNPLPGVVDFSGEVVGNTVSSATARSKPALSGNQLDLSFVNENSAHAFLFIALDTDYVNNGFPFISTATGSASQEMGVGRLLSLSNQNLESDFELLTELIWVGPGTFHESAEIPPVEVDEFGLAISTIQNLPGQYSVNISVQQAIPEPASVLIWSMLAGVGLLVRRHRQA